MVSFSTKVSYLLQKGNAPINIQLTITMLNIEFHQMYTRNALKTRVSTAGTHHPSPTTDPVESELSDSNQHY